MNWNELINEESLRSLQELTASFEGKKELFALVSDEIKNELQVSHDEAMSNKLEAMFKQQKIEKEYNANVEDLELQKFLKEMKEAREKYRNNMLGRQPS